MGAALRNLPIALLAPSFPVQHLGRREHVKATDSLIGGILPVQPHPFVGVHLQDTSAGSPERVPARNSTVHIFDSLHEEGLSAIADRWIDVDFGHHFSSAGFYSYEENNQYIILNQYYEIDMGQYFYRFYYISIGNAMPVDPPEGMGDWL